jgi:hypothetical protein
MRLRFVGALVLTLAVAASPVWAGGRPVDFPSAPVTVSVALPQAPKQADEPKQVVARENATPANAAESIPSVAARAVPDVSDPKDLVFVTMVVKANDATPVAATSSKGACPAAPTCEVFSISDFRWKTDAKGTAVINYKYNDANRRVLRAPEPAETRGAIHAAAATWRHWNSNIVMRDTGDTTARFGALGRDGTCADGNNVITWGRVDDPDAVGMAGMCLDKTRHVIRDADIALNISYWWSLGPNPRRATYDVQEIVTHEMGHWLSLLDIYAGGGQNQTMFGSADPNETRKRTLGLGDVRGLQRAYPCRSGDSCPRSGIVKD